MISEESVKVLSLCIEKTYKLLRLFIDMVYATCLVSFTQFLHEVVSLTYILVGTKDIPHLLIHVIEDCTRNV